jgi:hypothetical protein
VGRRYQIYATMMSFYVPLTVMVIVYVKILRVVADKKKEMNWKHRPSAKAVAAQQQKLVSVNVPNHIVKNGSHKRQNKTDLLLNAKNSSQNQNGGPLLPPPTTPSPTPVAIQAQISCSGPQTTMAPTNAPSALTTASSTLHRLKKGQLPLFIRSKS